MRDKVAKNISTNVLFTITIYSSLLILFIGIFVKNLLSY